MKKVFIGGLGGVLFGVILGLRAIAPNTVVATIGVGCNPSSVAVTPDNRYVYVANNNNNSIPGSDTVSVIDVATNTLLTTISDASFNAVYTVTINPAGTKVYVTNSGTTTVSVINVATNTVSAVITGFSGPSDMVIMPNGLTGYVSNYVGLASNTISIVNLTTNTISGTITIPGQNFVATLGLTSAGDYLYAANYNNGVEDGTITVIRTFTNSIVDTISGFFGPYNIVITADGSLAYVTNFGSNNFTPIGNTVSVVNLNTDVIIDTIIAGSQPAGAALTPDEQLLYISNYNDQDGIPTGQGSVNLIDTNLNFVIPPLIEVGQGAASVAITPNGEYAYVANYISNTVSVIALQSFQIVGQGCKFKKSCGSDKDYLNKITWSSTGSSLPVSYEIYADAALTDLLATIPATQRLQYLDHHTDPNVVYTYYIVGTNDVGTTSEPIAITVTEKCPRSENDWE